MTFGDFEILVPLGVVEPKAGFVIDLFNGEVEFFPFFINSILFKSS